MIWGFLFLVIFFLFCLYGILSCVSLLLLYGTGALLFAFHYHEKTEEIPMSIHSCTRIFIPSSFSTDLLRMATPGECSVLCGSFGATLFLRVLK